MHRQLIMVEGVPFTGKSTLSEFIAQQLARNDIPAQWVSEGELLQQYFPRMQAVLDQPQSLSEAVLAVEWSAFVDAVRQAPTTLVVDSALSYTAVYPLLAVDRSATAICAELTRIADLCVPLQPLVIHLTGDIAQLVPASIVERGEEWQQHLLGQSDATPYQQARGRSGLAGTIALLHETQALMHEVLADSTWHALTLDVSAVDWDTNRGAVLDALQIAEVRVESPALEPAELRAYIGTYIAEDPQSPVRQFTVRLEDDTLILYGPRMRYGPLVPVGSTRFHLRATRIDTEFVVEHGLARRLMLVQPDGSTRVFARA